MPTVARVHLSSRGPEGYIICILCGGAVSLRPRYLTMGNGETMHRARTCDRHGT
jgi:hypothetical protein